MCHVLTKMVMRGAVARMILLLFDDNVTFDLDSVGEGKA